MTILVLGSGVIGTSVAYYLARAGHDVTVIDRANHQLFQPCSTRSPPPSYHPATRFIESRVMSQSQEPTSCR